MQHAAKGRCVSNNIRTNQTTQHAARSATACRKPRALTTTCATISSRLATSSPLPSPPITKPSIEPAADGAAADPGAAAFASASARAARREYSAQLARRCSRSEPPCTDAKKSVLRLGGDPAAARDAAMARCISSAHRTERWDALRARLLATLLDTSSLKLATMSG